MARPPARRRGKAPSTQLLFRISIQRMGPGGRPLTVARSARRGKAWRGRRRGRKSVRFSRRTQPLPAFFLFMEQYRKELQASHPKWTVVQIAKKLGRMWHKLPRREKEIYMNPAKRHKGRRRMTHRRGYLALRRKKTRKNLVVCFTTKVSSLLNFLMSYL